MTLFMVVLGCYIGIALIFALLFFIDWLLSPANNKPIDNYDENKGVELIVAPRTFDELYEATRRK